MQKSDAGWYVCSAKNLAGTRDTSSAELKIIGEYFPAFAELNVEIYKLACFVLNVFTFVNNNEKDLQSLSV